MNKIIFIFNKNIVKISKAELVQSKKSNFYNKLQNALNNVKNNLMMVHQEGKTSIIFSGIAYHKRSSYPNYKNLNEFAVGIGVEKAMINKSGNRETISAMVFLDSHSDPQFSLSYEISKPLRLSKNVMAWAGINAGLTSRSDILNHLPIPYVFPTLGLAVGKLSIRSIIIPRLGRSGGNVVFLFGSYQLGK